MFIVEISKVQKTLKKIRIIFNLITQRKTDLFLVDFITVVSLQLILCTVGILLCGVYFKMVLSSRIHSI